MKLNPKVLAVSLSLLLSACAQEAKLAEPGGLLQLNPIFSSHMVLQRQQPIPVWGSAAPRQEISVTLGSDSFSVVANETGFWQVSLPAREAGGPYQLNVTAGESITLEDIYFGDVWLASGQSNMEWKVGFGIDHQEQEIADSNYPQIRYSKVKQAFHPIEQDELETPLEWLVASPETIEEFSAVAWFFAKEANRHQEVPIGIVDSTWGGTPAEAWTPAEALLELPYYQATARSVMTEPQVWQQKIIENQKLHEKKWQIINDVESALAQGVHLADYDDSQWQKITLPTAEPMSDVIWLRRSFELADSKQDVKLQLGTVVQNAHLYLNGELIEQKDWSTNWEVLDLPEAALKQGRNQIALRVNNDWNNQAVVGKPGEVNLIIGDKAQDISQGWAMNNKISPPIPWVEAIHWKTSFLYNAMIHPLRQMPIKGVIWYQGENNVGEARYYHTLFEQLITSWRSAWQQPEMPFVFTQLANFLETKSEPVESAWAELREAQRQTLRLPHTAMAVAIDIGEAEDIHPRNKQDVGKRLWRGAAGSAYGDETVLVSPQPVKAKANQQKVTIQFSDAGQGLILTQGDSPLGFALKGEAGSWHWATGKLKGNTVVLTVPAGAEHPNQVRYGWADNPKLNLSNSEGLPVSPFEMSF